MAKLKEARAFVHRPLLTGAAVDEAGNELDKTFTGLMAGFFFHHRQAEPFGVFETVDDNCPGVDGVWLPLM